MIYQIESWLAILNEERGWKGDYVHDALRRGDSPIAIHIGCDNLNEIFHNCKRRAFH